MIKFSFLGLIIVIIFSSCSYHIGTIGGGTASVTNNQFASIDFAYGTAKTVNFLGIGGNKKDALVLEAKRNLYSNYKLSASQVVGQTTVDFKRTIAFPLLITKVTVSSEIVDFSDDSIDMITNGANKTRFINSKEEGQFNLGEEVFYFKKSSKVFLATILDYKKGKYIIKFIDENDNLRIKKVDPLYLKSSMLKTEPVSLSELDKLFTPQNPKGALVRFRYKEEVLTGEIIEITKTSYFIKMEKQNGEVVGIHISESDIIK